VAALGGCASVGPDYSLPALSVPARWSAQPDPAIKPDPSMIRSWWTVFQDPLLTRYVEAAAAQNLDLLTAAARVREARARLGIVAGERYPLIDAAGDASLSQSSTNTDPGTPLVTTSRHRLGIDASWELDLFGRVRRSIEAASADLQATEEDRVDIMISLYAELARTYLVVRTAQARLAATEGNIASQRQVLNLTRTRFEYGLAADLDVAQAEDVLANSEAQVPPLRSILRQSLNTLALLLALPPGSLEDELTEVKPIPVPPGEVTVGVPSDLLRQRPDIRRAERTLAAETARIGVATADLYPRFALFGTLGLEATDAARVFAGGSTFYSFGPSLRWNVFDAGRIRSQIQAADARTEQALLQYEQTVLRALSEVENAMTAFVEERQRMEALQRSVAASRRTLKLAVDLYKEGLRDFQSVLDAERTLFDVENQLAVAGGNIAENLVQLYKALGGGWSPAGRKESGDQMSEFGRRAGEGGDGDLENGGPHNAKAPALLTP
jgi:NodT family efflux transporter outer membrane factor (OMF) lipoprotein